VAGGRAQMMNFGWHWNLQSRLYEATRTDFDHAQPPAMPASILELAMVRRRRCCGDSPCLPASQRSAVV
jgi:hypothetical protein